MTATRNRYPDDRIRGFMRERALQRQFALAQRQGVRPMVAPRKNVAHSTHWTRAARAVHALTVAWARRDEVAKYRRMAIIMKRESGDRVQVIDHGPSARPTVIVDFG